MITPEQILHYGVHPALGSEGQGWDIEQNPYELADFLSKLPPIQTALEIGTGYKAGFSRFMSQVLGWKVTSVDITNYGHTFDGVKFVVTDQFETDDVFDLVFIDGNHAYEAVSADYERYDRCAGKVLAFHDIAGLRQCEGAAKFWHEIAYSKGKLRKNFYEAITESDQRCGIGWVVKP